MLAKILLGQVEVHEIFRDCLIMNMECSHSVTSWPGASESALRDWHHAARARDN